MDRSDAELLAATVRGDREAFGAFYRRHVAVVVAVLLRETGDREQAADLAAEVFAAALLAAPRYRAEHPSARPWLVGIARNKAQESRRRGRAEDRARRRLGIASETIAEEDLDRVDELAGHDGRLLELVEQLPPVQRTALRPRDRRARLRGDRARDSQLRGGRAPARQPRARLAAGPHDAGAQMSAGDYFERVEAQLLDAVEREAQGRRRGRTRRRRPMALATAAVTCLLLVLVAALALPDPAPRDDDRSAAPAGSLPALMEVLRRPQRPDDAPTAVFVIARAAAARAAPPYAGAVDRDDIRRVAAVGGHRLYVAPLHGGRAALVILADGRDLVYERPYGLTPQLLRSGAYYIGYGLRPAGRGPEVQRALQLQLVPDDVTSVVYRYSPWAGMFAEPTEDERVPVADNVAVEVQRGLRANQPPAGIRTEGDEGILTQVEPTTRGAGPVAPATVCRGVTPPVRPRRYPSRAGLTTRQLCQQLGPPLRAHRPGPGELLLLYPDRMVVAVRDDRIHVVTNLASRDPFPPRFARHVPSTAAKLAR